MKRRSLNFRSAGFTLVEMMVCLVIAGMLAALAVSRLRPANGELNLSAALAKLESQDHQMRDRAVRSDQPGQLYFDVQTGEVSRIQKTAHGDERRSPIFSGTNGPRVEQMMIMGEAASRDGRYRVTSTGFGRTASYAMLVVTGKDRQWVVVSGLTGEFSKVDDASQIQDIFQQQNARTDAR